MSTIAPTSRNNARLPGETMVYGLGYYFLFFRTTILSRQNRKACTAVGEGGEEGVPAFVTTPREL